MMNRRAYPRLATRLLGAALIVVLSACGGEDAAPAASGRDAADPEGPAASPSDSAAPGRATTVSLPEILSRPYERDDAGGLVVLDDLPAAPDTAIETRPNRHDPAATDTIRTLRWPGLELDVHVAGSKEILAAVEVTGEEHATSDGLRVGLSRERVREIRGEPDGSDDGGEWVYDVYDHPHDPTSTTLRIAFDGDRVASLSWAYYVD